MDGNMYFAPEHTKFEYHTVHLYVLRNAEQNEEFKVQVIFDERIKIDFDPGKPLNPSDNFGPFIFHCKIDVLVNNNRQLYTIFKNHYEPIDKYDIRISRKVNGLTTHYSDVQRRQLRDPLYLSHYCLFDVTFYFNLFTNPPGKDVPFWRRLCFFTYFFLQQQAFEVAEICLDQFVSIITTRTLRFDYEQCHDFFEACLTYLPYVFNMSNVVPSLKYLLRIIGLLPITSKDLHLQNNKVEQLTTSILSRVSQHLYDIFRSLTTKEWPLLRKGLIVLLSIEIALPLSDDVIVNVPNLIRDIPTEGYGKDIATAVLTRLSDWQQHISGFSWIDLLILADHAILKIKHLELTKSFQVYCEAVRKFATVHAPDKYFQEELELQFDRLLVSDHLIINLESIIFLLNFLQVKPLESDPIDCQILRIVHSVIESSDKLPLKIKYVLYTLSVNIEQCNYVRDILRLSSSSPLLFCIQKTEFLLHLLNRRSSSSSEFYAKWFVCFLLPDGQEQRTDRERDEYQQLLKSWTDCFVHNRDMFMTMMMKIDIFIDAFAPHASNNQYLLHFIHHMVNLSFQQGTFDILVFRLIANALETAQSQAFLTEIKNQFFAKYLKYPQDLFKQMENRQNPLCQLLDIDYQQQGKNVLVRDLIGAICDKINIDKEEILEDMFSNSMRSTFTCRVLLEGSFQSLPIHHFVVKHLLALWTQWEVDGLRADQIVRWTHLTRGAKDASTDIWNFIGRIAHKQLQIETLISAQQEEMLAKLLINDQIVSCIDAYCQDANDKQLYLDLLKTMQKQFERDSVRSVQVPTEINQLLPLVHRLYPFSTSRSWLSVLEHQPEESEPIDNPAEVKDNISSNNRRPSTISKSNDIVVSRKQIKSLEHRESGQKTCISMLTKAEKILDQYCEQLKLACAEWEQLPVSELLVLFPNMHRDLQIFQSLIYSALVPSLVELFDYWEDRKRINHVSQGCINMLTDMNVQFVNITDILFKMLEINKRTVCAVCVTLYRNFCVTFSNCYSDRMRILISQYDLSMELIKFVHSVSIADADNLLEVFNDWDEGFINTKTVLDFVLLKTFIDEVYTKIESLRKDKSITFNGIINCFKVVWENTEFENILQCFETCSDSLSSLQQVHLELTNKGLSKRRRIFNIMHESYVRFVESDRQTNDLSNYLEYPFDVLLVPQSKNISDLSELRDYIRLIVHASSKKPKSENEHERIVLQQFVHFVDIIQTILNNLTSLRLAGNPSISQFFVPDKFFTCIDGDYHELIEFDSWLHILLDEWEKQLCTNYRNYVALTYFSCNQVWMVEDVLYNYRTIQSLDHIGYHLLKFIGIESHLIQSEHLPNLSEHSHERLQNIGQILTTQRSLLKLEEIQKESRADKKVFVVETSEEGILRAILSLFKMNNLPARIDQLFYCTTHTTWIEIQAFVYRCFYSRTLHQLIRPDELSPSIQDRFIRLLSQLIIQNPQGMLRLAIITTSPTARLQLINGLQTLQIVTIVRDQHMLDDTALRANITELLGSHCTLVTSRITGLGKSTFIRNEIRETGKHYIKFSVSGDVDIYTLAAWLRKYANQLNASSAAIHIDIGVIDNPKRLNEFFYCLLLFRSFCFGQSVAHIPSDLPIYIELDASPHQTNIQNDLIILKYLQSNHLKHINWKHLESNLPAIQLICNYIQAINDQTIIKRDINEETKSHLDVNTCIRLLQGHFLQRKNRDYVSWTQLRIFVSVYSTLFSSFARCGHLMAELVQPPQLRLDILESLLKSSDQFTSLSVETARQNQRSTNTNDSAVAFSDAIVRWDKIQPFTLVFTASDEPLFIYKKAIDVPQSVIKAYCSYYKPVKGKLKQQEQERLLFPDYDTLTHQEFFVKLASLSRKYFNKSICPRCYKQYEYEKFQCEKCSTKDDLIRPRSTDTDDIEEFQKFIAEKLKIEYVLTPDNYVKMLLIYFRAQSRLPILIMGETGCGKTALVQFLCQKILDDELAIFRIHAGITSQKIIATMKKLLFEFGDFLKDKNKRLWIFFDEFNTTPSIGLLKEILCERTMLGEPLPTNMVFLGACNPQRRKNAENWLDEDIGMRKDRDEMQREKNIFGRSLLYNVVSIPETMLEYVWDYGFLDESIEFKYIETMLNSCELLSMVNDWFKMVIILLAKSQQFFRNREDVSSVSLRDVARFCRLYNWHLQVFMVRESDKFDQNPLSYIQRASLIALLLCYYFRLNSSNYRQKYIETIEITYRSSFDNISNLLELLDSEQEKLIQKMHLPPGTAQNRALKDNIFVLISCIFNRIPVFICGKPGCSKSLSVQIVISALRGKKSKDPFFQTLPELFRVAHQGSQSCTSESVIKVFERAKKRIEEKGETNILPVIVFDEIGLAELSPHNPLKVLHSELEVETCQYGFIGLSNSRLDASKMNRALYLSCPEPNINDLQSIATSISFSIVSAESKPIRLTNSIIKGLANSYSDLYEHMKLPNQSNKNYFGLRDYYSLIKGVAWDSIQIPDEDYNPYEIIRRQLRINFDGILDSSNYIWKQFCQHINKPHLFEEYPAPTFKQLLDHSLSSRTNRYLMLISEDECGFDYVERYINNKQQQLVRTMIGSCLPGDLSDGTYSERYSNRALMDIILYAETNVTLVMHRMGHLYDNLYDLFNQNFATAGRKKYCQIALGARYHPPFLVNDGFYCVVFVRQQDLNQYDSPFLNRFEKHILDLKNLVHQRHAIITSNLLNWLLDLLPTNLNKYHPLLQHLFVDYSDHYICNLVIDSFTDLNISVDDDKEEDKDSVMNYCKKKLLRTSSFDLPLVLSLRSDKNDDVHHLIQQYYDIHTDLSFPALVNQAMEQTKISNQLVYTYTQLYHVIDYSAMNNNHDRVHEVKLANFKTEFELINRIKEHYHSDDKARLLLIRVDYHKEYDCILWLKHILLNERLDTSNRGVWLVFHLQRNMLNQITNNTLFNGWFSIMIDDLNKHQLVSQSSLLNPSYKDFIANSYFSLSECMFNGLIDKCLTKCRHSVIHKHQESEINARRNRIIDHLTTNRNDQQQSLRSIIQAQLLMLVQTVPFQDHHRFTDWRYDLLTNPTIIGSCRSISDAIQITASLFYENYLWLLFLHLEKYSFIDSYLFHLTVKDANIHEYLYQIWLHCLTTTLKTLDTTMMNIDLIEIPLVLDLVLPGSTKEYEIIRQIRETITQQWHNDQEITVEEITDSAMKLLTSKSFYGSDIELILKTPDLLTLYYNDQLVLTQNEAKIYQPSIKFVQRLLTSNPTRSLNDHLKHLLIDHVELIEVLKLFQIGTQLIGEDEILVEQQFINYDSDIQMNPQQSEHYVLILSKEKFYLIPPRTSTTDFESFLFECDGDPLIETSLMNLIELLISPSVIDRIENIEELTTTYGMIVQGVLALNHYSVDNLEKLRSYLSLVRCITALIPFDQASIAFKQVCLSTKFNGTFSSCDAIHSFVEYLDNIILDSHSNVSELFIQQTLLKLEIEFLKNFLVDNGEKYFDILTLISKSNNNLWKYSAKILAHVTRKLNLFSTIKDNNGQLPNDEKYIQFDQDFNDSSRKIERLMVNRIHMQLMLSSNGQESIENMLKSSFEDFQENMQQIENTPLKPGVTMISLIAWIKYYTHMYSFALTEDSHDEIMIDIDLLLTRDESAFCSTLKLFVIKQLCQIYNISLDTLREQFRNRNVGWIRPMIEQSSDPQVQKTRNTVILPTPLFECREEFIRINNILATNVSIDTWRDMIRYCSHKQDSSYCFLIWFIHYYARFYIGTEKEDNHFIQMIVHDLRQELTSVFECIGYRFIASLCLNGNNSYFHIKTDMSKDEIHRRLVALNFVALIISFKALPLNTYLGNLLFDGNLKTPENYREYWSKAVCLPGLIPHDPIIKQMIDVRTQVQLRLDKKQLKTPGKFIFKCSHNCLFFYYFENCGQPDSRGHCPFCKKIIGGEKHVLFVREPPQIKMTIEEGFKFIAEYIEQFNQKTRFGYYNIVKANESFADEKPDHLDGSVSFRFIHLLTHSILLFLSEFNMLNNDDLIKRSYFQDHFEVDYRLLCEQSNNPDQCYIWLFKLINHMLENKFKLRGSMNNNNKVIELEKTIEEKLISTHIMSIANEIQEYKLAYTEFEHQRGEVKTSFDAFVDELIEDEHRFPLCNFFNVTNIHTTNPIDIFRITLQNMPSSDKAYPVTSFLLKRLDTYANIQYLYPIVTFTNHLIQKFNYRIKRNDAAEKTIAHYLRNGLDHEKTAELYEHFVNAWNKITLKEFRFGCQILTLEHTSPEEQFGKHAKIAVVLLNISKDNSSILLAACLRTLGKLQNEIVEFFHNTIVDNASNQAHRNITIPVQAIRDENLVHIDADYINQKLITDGFTINYGYGKSKDIIYDYEEIEVTLRDMISRLPLIGTEKLNFLNYQFELYSENTSLITDVRARVRQEPLAAEERTILRRFMFGMENDNMLHYLGSLDYIFTYLRNIDIDYNTLPDIQTFVERHIRSSIYLNDNVFRRPPFSTISLKHIIDLYELLEEYVFDRVIRNYVRQDLSEEAFSSNERARIIDQFIEMTVDNKKIALCFQNIDCWIAILKRLMIRVLNNVHVSLDVALQLYLERADLWTSDVTEEDIQTFQINDDILLQHTFVILNGLERKRGNISTDGQQINAQQQQPIISNLQNTPAQRLKAEGWLDNYNNNQKVGGKKKKDR